MIKRTNIIIIDDHQILIDGVVELLKNHAAFHVVGTASGFQRALELVENHQVDVAICDLNMPDIKGSELIPKLKAIRSALKVVVLSMHEEKHVIKEVLKAGADGYVLKRSTHNELIDAITAVMANQAFVSEAITQMLVDEIKHPTVIDHLSEREIEIIKLIVQEKTNRQIGDELCISEKTVETHKRNIFRKTNCSSAVGLTKFALSYNLV
ncbi:DNA-binding response regulator, NarL/FixJ family, contains REC and HTH domains [Reichenbachiella faecimaris]|uniref:DNA-binding response regulator, NarL/FixJ family, contains REC and HTH domains n=1 Tax=Reichenbachiella faecimaris TaxID=692418 RepID=A0A1W2GL13_REIFA|nr:response regulator transcription factor [Reichenbachiella faecimaris]SMD37327.1 DNA-binding response regulator, NarL/FixJ family, contains REC and HTH domains [Reichenbachiella faecimaris]